VFIWGEPIWVPKESGRDELEQKRKELEERLCDLTEKADHFWE